MKFFIKRITENKSGFWLALAAVLFVCGWRIWVISQKPTDWKEIAYELGSIPQFRQNLMANHGNTRVVYSQDTEKNIGYYMADIATHKTHLICDTRSSGLYGWSLDDSRFA